MPRKPAPRKSAAASPPAQGASRRLSHVAFDLVARAIPGELVREVASAGAPMARYGGRTTAGAAALSRALKLLAQPPAAQRPPAALMSTPEVAERVGRTARVVSSWASDGLLGEPAAKGVKQWDRGALERARLIDYLLRHGTTREELKEAAAEDRLPLLVLNRSLSGNVTVTAAEAAQKAGLPLEIGLALARAMGVAAGEPDEPLLTHREVSALRIIGALRSVYSDEDLVEMASVVGRAMHEVADASLELFRRRLARPFVESGASELEMMLRLATIVDLTTPLTGPILELVLRRQLEAAAREETVLHLEREAGSLDGQVTLAIGFADIVGFTAASAQLSALEVSRMAETLLRAAEDTLPAAGARIVKSIGDAVMFSAGDPVSATRAALDLLDAAREAKLPPVRVGIAHGPALRAYADYFGRTVNLASRLCDIAAPDEVLLLQPAVDIAPEDWAARGLRASAAGTRSLRGIKGRVAVLKVDRRK